MHETEFIRRQLALERAHLREILEAVRRGCAVGGHSRALADYLDWASQRLIGQLDAHRSALQAAPGLGADTRAQLDALSGAAVAARDGGNGRPVDLRAERLLALMAAWTDPLETAAGRTLRVTHWRQAAQLSADTIFQERQLYGAARAAAGLS
jgi:hypothetical protein